MLQSDAALSFRQLWRSLYFLSPEKWKVGIRLTPQWKEVRNCVSESKILLAVNKRYTCSECSSHTGNPTCRELYLEILQQMFIQKPHPFSRFLNSCIEMESTSPLRKKPSRRFHHKSRAGCRQCRSRKTKVCTSHSTEFFLLTNFPQVWRRETKMSEMCSKRSRLLVGWIVDCHNTEPPTWPNHPFMDITRNQIHKSSTCATAKGSRPRASCSGSLHGVPTGSSTSSQIKGGGIRRIEAHASLHDVYLLTHHKLWGYAPAMADIGSPTCIRIWFSPPWRSGSDCIAPEHSGPYDRKHQCSFAALYQSTGFI